MTRPPCETCDFVGPDLPGLVAQARTMHRAYADVGWAIADALRAPAFIAWLSARLPKATP